MSVAYCTCEAPVMDVEHDAGCRRCGLPVDFSPTMNEYERRFRDELGGPFPMFPRHDEPSPDKWTDADWQRRFDRESEAMRRRDDFVMTYAWAIPNEAALDVLAGLDPLVEVGAGGGYWAMLLRERGVDVVAYDEKPGTSARDFRMTEKIESRLWTDVQRAGARVGAEHPERTLFLCWPPYDSRMAFLALSAYLAAGGQTLAYVGEGQGGCNAEDSFFHLRDSRMVEDEDLLVALPQWPGLHDYLTVHRRL